MIDQSFPDVYFGLTVGGLIGYVVGVVLGTFSERWRKTCGRG